MKKIVNESLVDWRKTKNLNEGILGSLKKMLKKVKSFFVGIFNGEEIPGAISPINVAIMEKKGLLKNITYIPSQDDVNILPYLNRKNAEKKLIKENKVEKGNVLNEGKITLEHPNSEIPNIDNREMYMYIRMALMDKDHPILIWGAPGIGKTEIVNSVLKIIDDSKRLIDVQTSKMMPDDWALPAIYTNEVGEQFARDIPKTWLPCYIPTGDPEEDKKRDEIANGGNGGIIFLDELSRASSSVQDTCLKLVNERIIGESKLGSKWIIIGAANREDDDPESQMTFSTALNNRFSQYNFVPDFKSWKKWGMKSGKVNQKILDFIEFNEQYFYTLDTDNPGIFASPRSWTAASRALNLLYRYAEEENYRITENDIVKVIGSNVGVKTAIQFATFFKLLEYYTKDEIRMIFTDPKKVKLPKKAGSGYDLAQSNALVSIAISSTRGRKLTPKEWENYVRFLVILDNPSLASKGMKMMTDIHDYIHDELGEEEGKDKYVKGVEIYQEKYGEFH